MKFKIPSKKTLIYGGAVIVSLIYFSTQCANIVLTNDLKKELEAKSAFAIEGTSQAITETNLPNFSSAIFRLYECGGKIGIYDAKTDILIDIIDVFVSTLPKTDRMALKKGIEIFTFAELAEIIEDFTT